MPLKEHVSHARLKTLLENSFDSRQLELFKTSSKSHGLRAGELSRMDTFIKVFEALERKNIVGPGNYGELKKMLRGIDMDAYVKDIEDAERQQGVLVEESDVSVHTATLDSGIAASHAAAMPAAAQPQSVAAAAPVRRQPRPVATVTASTGQADVAAAAAATPELPPVKKHVVDKDDADMSEGMLDWRTENMYSRGPGLVIMIRNFTKNRGGSDIDEANIIGTFKGVLNYDVMDPSHDLTKEKLLQQLDQVKTFITMSKLLKKEYSSLIVFISSHGEKSGIKTMDQKVVSVDEITSKFNGDKLPEMAGKPKVFLIQACRGKALGRGVSIDKCDDEPEEEQQATVQDDVMPSLALQSIPVNADMLLANATTEGTRAWRNDEEGSWFIKHLCDTIKERSNQLHLLEIMALVNGLVAKRVSSEEGAKQMPEQITTLTKLFFL
ncbi:caspase-3-like [Ptychodera flava]|uniref:caspase-3-like n=1 Tax=Ptychodera flava TaxID=63121 RepID=UPI00396A3EE4